MTSSHVTDKSSFVYAGTTEREAFQLRIYQSRQPGHFIILDWVGAPSSKAHLGLFGGRGIDKKCSCHYRINHLTSINVDIERPDDGNVLIAGRISVSDI